MITTIVHGLSQKSMILIRTVFHGFSWKLSIKYDDPSQKLMGFHVSVHRDKLILAGRIYECFEFHASVARHFAFWPCFSQKKKMSCQFQLPLQGILLDFVITSLPLNYTEVGCHVQRVTKLLPDPPDIIISGKIRNCSKDLGSLTYQSAYQT